MSNNISLTIPSDNPAALVAGATMLLTLAGKIPAMELPDEPAALEPLGPIDTPPVYIAAGPEVAPEPDDSLDEPEPAAVADDSLDADGLPYDSRIHAGTRTRTQDGRWKRKRGVEPAEIERVETELRALMAIPSPVPLPTPEELKTLETTLTGPTTFSEFLKAVTGLVTGGRVAMPRVVALVQESGVAAVPMLQQREDLIPSVWAAIHAEASHV